MAYARCPTPGTGYRHCWRYSDSRSVGGRASHLSVAAGRDLPHLFNAELTLRQSLFIGAATPHSASSSLFARHLFCRFGCAVGLFQSLSWMANDRAMVVGFDATRATRCRDCNNACDNVRPMRLKPRTIKRKMFTCTECAQCISACTTVQGGDTEHSLLRWVEGADALPVVSGRPARPSAHKVEPPATQSAPASAPLCQEP